MQGERPGRVTAILLGAGALVLVLLVVFAEPIDKTIAGWFYVPGEGFPARWGSGYHLAVREAVELIATVSAVCLIAGLIWRVLLGRRLLGLSRAVVLYLFLAFALGPGVLANSVLKEHWDRARPSQIVEFGGDKAYTPPLVIADQCDSNCSFVSGDASVGFIFTALGFAAVGRRWRVLGFAAGISLGTIFGITRIAQGGHFFTDVVFAGVFMVAIAWLLHHLVVQRDVFALPMLLLPRGKP